MRHLVYVLWATAAGLSPLALAGPQTANSTLSSPTTATSSASNLGPTIDLDNCCNSSLDATAWAIVYALPLIQFVNQTSLVYREANGKGIHDGYCCFAELIFSKAPMSLTRSHSWHPSLQQLSSNRTSTPYTRASSLIYLSMTWSLQCPILPIVSGSSLSMMCMS